jgi:stearoyl-CoA desaturase (delta-9 desaturase)
LTAEDVWAMESSTVTSPHSDFPTETESAVESTSPAESPALPTTEPHDFPEAPLGQKVTMLLAVTLPLVGMVIGMVLLWQRGFMGWLNLALFLLGWLVSGMGITVGFHRLLTHRSFDTYRWVRAAWMLAGALSVEGSPFVWCAVHRRHHQFSDQPGDPHSPHLGGDGWFGWWRGLWHSHTGWLFTGIWSYPDLKRYIPDLLADPLLVRLDRLYGLWILLSFAIPFAVGGLVTRTWEGAWLGLLWGGFVRVFFTHHVTWSINSICHLFGGREFVSNDHSRNNFLCGIFAFGEGWHNNHHAFPTSARHGLRWWQIDGSWLVIRTMQALGLAWNVRLPSPQALREKRLP